MNRILAFLLAMVMLLAQVVLAEESFAPLQESSDAIAKKIEEILNVQEKLRLKKSTSIIDLKDEYLGLLDTLVPVKKPHELVSLANDSLKGNVHPRLFGRQETFDRIKKLIKEDKFIKAVYEKMSEYTDGIIKKSPIKRGDPEVGPETLAFARECVDRALLCGMMYRLTSDNKYLDFLYAQIEIAINDFMQWDSIQVLQSAELTFGISITYDWLYDGLNNNQREHLRSVLKKRLQMVDADYAMTYSSFVTAINNWNGVCNGSYGSAALAILCEEPDFASEKLHNAVKSIRNGMSDMIPYGGFSEGPGYWAYQVQYITYLLSSLESTFGSDLGLGDMLGFSDTAFYQVYMYGPTYRAFNYADAGEVTPVTVYNYWFSKRYGIDGLQGIAREVNPAGTDYGTWEMKGTDSLIFLWYTEMEKNIYDNLPTGRCFKGKVPTASLRSEWENPLATFVAFKGGHNQASHGNIDLGTFVLDALGKRWVSDLGGEDYGMEGYWDFSEKGGRWEYFSQRAEAHNIFVINPTREPDQDVYEKADIVEFDTAKNYGIIDLSDVYKKNAHSAKRGIALCGDSVIVRDEIKTKNTDDTIIWGINTKAEIELGHDGKYADLILGDDRMRAYIIGENDYRFEVAKAESMVYTRKEGEKDFTSTAKRLVIKTYKGGSVDFTVQFSPYSIGQNSPQAFHSVKNLDEWKNSDSVYSYDGSVDMIFMNNEPLNIFSANKMGYVIYLTDENIPQMSVDYDSVNSSVIMSNANKIGESTIIEVNSKDPRKNDLRYSFDFKRKSTFGEPEGKVELIPSKIDFSNIGNVANPEISLMDGRLDTRWAAEGECNIVFAFDKAVDMDMITVAFHIGNQRQSKFDLEVSEDGVNYTNVFSGLSSGTSNSPEQFAFSKQKVKYVKFLGHGNSTSMWNNITEFAFWG